MFTYREEIDGLRCVAILPVIFYHAGLRMFFAGGYVGVDIFFVISGYLITSVIIHECEENKFSLVNFYERRCRRILPALFFILFLNSFVAYFLMLPEQLKEFGETLISILCLSSNVYFSWKDDGYFSQLSDLNPLVHTWSLAVEEQFYFVFPLLCFFFYRKRTFFYGFILFCAIASLIVCQWGGNISIRKINEFQMFSQPPLASFYLPFGRIWELLIGSFLAFSRSITTTTNRRYSQLFSFLGLLLILLSIVFFDNRLIPPFPNIYTLIPTLGSALIIHFGEQTTFVGYLLSTRFCRWIGLISYSAYLWHQSILAYLRLSSLNLSENLLIICTIVTVFPLSVFSYFLIEQPFRDKKRCSRQMIFILSGLCAFVTLLMALFLIRTANQRSTIVDDGKATGTDTYLSDLKKYGHWQYVVRDFDKLGAKKKKFSTTTNSITNTRTILIGDSFAQDFYNMIIENQRMKKNDILVYFIFSRCQIYMGNEDRKRFIEPKHHQQCTNKNDIKLALPLIRQAKTIFLASNWYYWSAERLPTTLKLLNLTKDQQVFIIGPKHFGDVRPKLYVDKTKEYRLKQYQYPKAKVIEVNNLLQKILDKSIYVNVQKLICKGVNQTCPLFTPDGKLISHDGAHLTKYGARFVGNVIFKNKPLNKIK